MKKREIVRDNVTFNNIILDKNFYKNDTYVIYYANNDLGKKRFGIAVSKKIGNAVTRNLIKRRIRSIVDKIKFMFKNEQDYIIMVRTDAPSFMYQHLQKKMAELLEKGES